MAFIVIPSGDVDQGSVVDESLMSGKIKNDLDDLNTRVVALEALSGGGVAASDAESVFANIIAGGETNEAKFWKLRHYPSTSNLPGHNIDSGEDFEANDTRERFMHDPSFSNLPAFQPDPYLYLSRALVIQDTNQLQFRIKKGENFFCIGCSMDGASSSTIRVYVDGVNANTVGLKDENGATVPSSFSVNSGGPAIYGRLFHYYGLDGEEHIITIKNENGAAGYLYFGFVDIGYRSVDYAIDHKIRINAGVADVGGIAASFNQGEFSFTEPTEGLCNGYTGMLKINEAGTVTKVDGISPARTEIKPNSAISFSSAVTTLPVKNHFPFPTNGICLFQMPDGSKWFFSYNAKGGATVQSQSLDSIIWQKQPNVDFTFLPDKAGANYVVNEIRGDGRIDLWAKAPILIDGTNNKIDFEITVNGTTTNHTATVPSGRYSSDIIPLGSAIVKAMQTAKSINGRYFAMWSEESQLWSVGVNDPEVSQLDFEWSTGANSASSLGPTLGFTSDSIGQKSYVSPAIKQHKAQRVFVADQNIRSADHPSIRYDWTEVASQANAMADAIVERYPGLTSYRTIQGGSPFWEIYPDQDCTGMTLFFMRLESSSYISAMIDSRDHILLGSMDTPANAAQPSIGSLVPLFLSFPKGTNKISLFIEQADYYEIQDHPNNEPVFFGYRQHYTKPPWEALTPQEKVLKTFEVMPIRLFGTYYAHNTALYTPQPTNDNINTITESGTWNQMTSADVFNTKYRDTSTLNGYVEVEFVLQGNGGGISLLQSISTSESLDATMYLSTAAINEATDLVERDIQYITGVIYDCERFFHIGLPAGTYKARFKTQHASRLMQQAIIVYDTVPPQLNAPTLTDIANTGQSVAFPLYGRRRAPERYAKHLIPEYIGEGVYKRGVVTNFEHSNASAIVEYQEPLNAHNYHPMFWASLRSFATGDYHKYTTFCRSITKIGLFGSTYSTVVQPAIDGRNLNTISFAEQVKGGFAPSATRNSASPILFFDFQKACTFSASLTYNITDTRGLRTGKAILVDNVGAKEEVFIASFVTDTSLTISKALTVLTPANIVKVLFWGVHNLKTTSADATQWYSNGYLFEPLPIEESILQKRVSTETIEETVELEQVLAGTGVGVTQFFNYPLHSDGEAGDAKSTEFVFVNNSIATTENLKRRMRGVVPNGGSGVVARTLSLKSKRKIVKNFDFKVRG